MRSVFRSELLCLRVSLLSLSLSLFDSLPLLLCFSPPVCMCME